MVNAYFVNADILEQNTLDPICDVFFANSQEDAKLMLREKHPTAEMNDMEVILLKTNLDRNPGILQCDYDDPLYMGLWEMIGPDKLVKIKRIAEEKYYMYFI